jgi:hypothetical protein
MPTRGSALGRSFTPWIRVLGSGGEGASAELCERKQRPSEALTCNGLVQSRALVDAIEAGAVVWFFGDTSGVFDEMMFASTTEAEVSLHRNGFRRYAEDAEARDFIAVPQRPFRRQPHPHGPIYSSGRFWK